MKRKLDPARFHQSQKRAGVYFIRPGVSTSWVQEDDGKIDQPLRDAIEVAYRAFWNSYNASNEKAAGTT